MSYDTFCERPSGARSLPGDGGLDLRQHPGRGADAVTRADKKNIFVRYARELSIHGKRMLVLPVARTRAFACRALSNANRPKKDTRRDKGTNPEVDLMFSRKERKSRKENASCINAAYR